MRRRDRGSVGVRVGIVGVGQMAVEAHLPVLLGMPRLSVAWIADRDDRKAATISRAIGVEPVPLPTDPAQLPGADVVLLAVPYGARLPFYESFSQRGAAVYVEKPFARSADEHQRLCAMFPPSRLGCGFQRRSSGVVRLLRDVIGADLFGPLRTMRVEFGGLGTRSGSYQSDVGLAGGGMLFDVAVHALDGALFAAGASRVDVTDVTMTMEQGFDVHTEAHAEVTAEADQTIGFDLLVTNLQRTGMTTVCRFDHATVTYDMVGDGDLWVTAGSDGSSKRMKLQAEGGEYPKTPAQLLHAQWSGFLDAVDAGEPNYTCASETATTSSLIDQLYAR